MTKKAEHFSAKSLLLYGMVFVFACLLLSGGARLIGTDASSEPVQRPAALVRAAFACAPGTREETAQTASSSQETPRVFCAVAQNAHKRHARVISDANGNVLGSASYMRAVYMTFSLGDGFV